MFKNAKTRAMVVMMATMLNPAAWAEPAWVSDQFEVTLRSGPSTSNAIQLMVRSGTRLEVLERDPDSGYSRVQTGGGTEGWVLSRYLMSEPAAREQLAELTSQLTNATTRGSSLTSQLEAVRGEYDTATSTVAALERDRTALERTAANVLSINEQNKSLREQLAATEIQVATLEQENRELGRQTTRYWFMTGALVLLVGMGLGLWLPRIRWQRRSRYDRF